LPATVLQTADDPAECPVNKANSPHQRSLAPDLRRDTCQTDPDLAAVVDAWDRLPEAVKAGIVAMIRAATRG
jgi:hypothetical protein